MSIETLLEAAKYLELQAQQQQKAREDELKEKLQQKTECWYSDINYISTIHINNVPKVEELRFECRPAPAPPSLPPQPMPVTVIPIPIIAPNPAGSPTLPVTKLSPPAAPPLLASPKRELPSPREQQAAAPPQLSPQVKAEEPAPGHGRPAQNHQQPPQLAEAKAVQPAVQPVSQRLLQVYPGAVVSAPPPQQQQHALLPHAAPLLQPAPPPNGALGRGSPTDDSRQLDNKKRPGGAGTREVHNKLEKNRRAHLKECFETLKKNIPNIDEKKTSNLSVLRSALRYIQTLKRKEKDYEHDMERLAREKIATQQRLAELKNELSQWMDVMEIDRVLRQTVQPEEDQASTSTASEGEDGMDEDLEEEAVQKAPPALAIVPPSRKAEPSIPAQPLAPPPAAAATTSIITQHVSVKPPAPPHQPPAGPPPQPPSKPKTPLLTASPSGAAGQPLLAAAPAPPTLHPTVIAHASVSHPSVIQTVNHVIHGGGPKRVAHLAPAAAATGAVQLAPGRQPIGHITVHPVAHLSQHLPALYQQPVAVTQPAVVGHITHTFGHAHRPANAAAPNQAATAHAIVGKQTVSTQMMAHTTQLVGQTVINPVTMVTMPSFPISTLKLA
ncbi:max-binding protein MNT [Menidia menidia]